MAGFKIIFKVIFFIISIVFKIFIFIHEGKVTGI